MDILDTKEKVIEKLNELALEQKYVFRGISKDEQKLPHVVREGLEEKEIEMLEKLEKNASFYLNDADFFGLASQAQHYGVPTRLLDFTYNPFVALYFAVYDTNPDEYYTILSANPTRKQTSLHVPVIPRMDSMQIDSTLSEKYKSCLNILLSNYNEEYKTVLHTEIKELISERKILFVDSNMSNQRLIMQQGLFMFPYTLDEKAHREILKKNTNEIHIAPSLRKELLEYLNTLGINAYRIMPDLASICHYIRKIAKEESEDSR